MHGLSHSIGVTGRASLSSRPLWSDSLIFTCSKTLLSMSCIRGSRHVRFAFHVLVPRGHPAADAGSREIGVTSGTLGGRGAEAAVTVDLQTPMSCSLYDNELAAKPVARIHVLLYTTMPMVMPSAT